MSVKAALQELNVGHLPRSIIGASVIREPPPLVEV